MHSSQDYHRFLIEQIPAIIYTAALKQNSYSFLYVSPQVESIFGYPVSAWLEEYGLYF